MSSYDDCRIVCPSCRSFVDCQSKAGDGGYKTYAMEKTPLLIIADVEEESKHGRVECFSCGCALAVVVNWSVAVRPLSEQRDYDEDWKTIGEDDDEEKGI